MKTFFRDGTNGRMGVGLFVMTFLAFSPVLRNSFIGLDDGVYITQNPNVSAGLTWEGFKWAFQPGYSANWHPLTWLSHMLDVQLFGMNPAGHHLVNLLFHCMNAVMLFAFMASTTRARGRSALVAALFAVHPLHVESVAWAAERKDVLSTFFMFLALLAYARWARQEVHDRHASTPTTSAKWYYLSALLFVLGLMSKPMLVTVPFVLLLIDFWPLNRFSLQLGGLERRSPGWGRLLLEKAPFFVLAAGSSGITVLAQQKGEAFWLQLPLLSRMGNAIASYAQYLLKTLWPFDLAVFYPHPDARYPLSTQWPSWVVVTCAVLLAVSCVAVFLPVVRKNFPWLTTGWLWFLGMMVPVIGIVQVGLQGMADPYTYVPLVGVFICLVWSGERCLRQAPQARSVVPVIILGFCSVLTYAQASRWRNNLTLFEHALAVTRNNPVAHFQVGTDYGKKGDLAKAEAHFRAALEADPKYYRAHYSLGLLLEGLGKPAEAAEHYQRVLAASPESAGVRTRLAACLAAMGQQQEAVRQYQKSLETDPLSAEAHHNLAALYVTQGQRDQAVEHFAQSARLQEDVPDALADAAEELLRRGRFQEAEARFAGLAAFDPGIPFYHVGRGRAYIGLNQPERAKASFDEAIRLLPGDVSLREAVEKWMTGRPGTNQPGSPY